MNRQKIIYEFIYQEFDAVQIEFHSMNQLEKFLLDNDCFAKAIGYRYASPHIEVGFTGSLKALVKQDGGLVYIPFATFQELKVFLTSGQLRRPATDH